MTQQFRGTSRRRIRKALDDTKKSIEHLQLIEKFKENVVFYHWNKLDKIKEVDYIIIHIKFSEKINFNQFRVDFLERMGDYINGEKEKI